MKHSQLVWTAFALWAAAGSTTLALACDQKTSSASTASAVACPSAMSAAACKSAGMSCASKGASASAASMTAISSDHCAGKSAASASTASMSADHCAGKTSSASASTASMSADHCAGKTSNASAAAACKRAASATAAASAAAMAGHCRGEGLVKVADASVHADCEGCADMARCAQEIAGAGARVQVVPLKNGVMYVYTAESSSGVRVVQAAVAHRNERLASWTTAGDRVHLCSECKAMRGAAASGKLNREVVNIEGGCLTLMTSSDPTIVARLHEMASASLAASRTKS